MKDMLVITVSRSVCGARREISADAVRMHLSLISANCRRQQTVHNGKANITHADIKCTLYVHMQQPHSYRSETATVTSA